MTEAGLEIDLVVDRPGQKRLLIEIKSADSVQAEDLNHLNRVAHDMEECEAVCFSCDTRPKKINNIMVYPWQQGIKYYFGESFL